MIRAARLLVIGIWLSACAREAAIPPAPRALDVPPMDAGAPPSPVPPRARGEVTTSILNRDGGHWGAFLTIEPDAVNGMKSCYTQALAGDPTVTGWAMFDVGPYGSNVALADASALPRPLLVCLEKAVKTMRPAGQGLTFPECVLYVSLR